LEIEDTTLVPAEGDTKAKGTGVKREIDVDTVIFCIGDKVDDNFGLPVKWNQFVKSSKPRFPVDGVSYEVMDPVSEAPIEGIFVAGWSREASHGLVGVARKDGESGAQVVSQYLHTLEPIEDPQAVLENVRQLLHKLNKPVISKADIQRLEAVEQAEAERRMLEEFKFSTNDEMLSAIGVTLPAAK
jgi:ferredoxin--NADP+ reductase